MVLRDVQRGDDLLPPFCGNCKFFAVLKRLIELPGQVSALTAGLPTICFSLAQAIFETFQRVRKRCSPTGQTFADPATVAVFGVDEERRAFVEPLPCGARRRLDAYPRRSGSKASARFSIR